MPIATLFPDLEGGLPRLLSGLAAAAPGWSPCHLVTLSPGHLFAAGPSFPRGPGLYFSPLKLLALLAVYLCWVRTCWWVDQDARELKLPRKTWNPLLFGAGMFGLLVVWVLPTFWLAFGVLLLLYLATFT